MATVRLRMTPEQVAIALIGVRERLQDTSPVTKKLASRFERSFKVRVEKGKNADGSDMERLHTNTLQAIGRDEKEDVIGIRAFYGNKPLKFTGQMKRGIKGQHFKSGFIVYIMDSFKQKVANWQSNRPTGRELHITVSEKMAKHLALHHNLFMKPGTVIKRTARVPFAINGKQLRTSIRELNAHVMEPFFLQNFFNNLKSNIENE